MTNELSVESIRELISELQRERSIEQKIWLMPKRLTTKCVQALDSLLKENDALKEKLEKMDSKQIREDVHHVNEMGQYLRQIKDLQTQLTEAQARYQAARSIAIECFSKYQVMKQADRTVIEDFREALEEIKQHGARCEKVKCVCCPWEATMAKQVLSKHPEKQ